MMLTLVAATQIVGEQILYEHSKEGLNNKPLLTIISNHKSSVLKSHENLPWSL